MAGDKWINNSMCITECEKWSDDIAKMFWEIQVWIKDYTQVPGLMYCRPWDAKDSFTASLCDLGPNTKSLVLPSFSTRKLQDLISASQAVSEAVEED